MSPSSTAAVARGEIAGEAPVFAIRVGGAELVDEIADDWRELCAEGARNEPFYRPEWIGAYLRAFAPRRPLVLATVRNGSRLRAVLPLVRRAGLFAGLPARVLESASNDHSARFDVVHGEDDGDAALECLWRGLKSQDGWDVIALHDVPAGGAGERLLRLAAADGWPVGQWSTNDSPYVGVAGVTDPLALAQHAHFRANLRRRLRKASESKDVSLQRIDVADPEALELFYAIEASGWKGRAGSAIECSPATRRFYDDVARSAAAFGYLSLYVLRFGREPVAAHFGLFYNRHYYTPKVAFDERYASAGPGHLIIDAVLREVVTRGAVEFDFLGPSMPWKLEWTSQVRPHSHCYVFRNSAFGRTLRTARCNLMVRLRPLARKGRALLARGGS